MWITTNVLLFLLNLCLIGGQSLNPTLLTLNAEEIDFIDGNITARAPYPHLNIKIRRNGQFVDKALDVQPGTPLEMIIYLDEESRHVYGLLVSFLKVTATAANNRSQEEIIVLNGCSIDPYIFGNFETVDGGDSLSAKFRAFKFPESNYVKFVGTVNVCLNECLGVPCGNGQYGYGRRRKRSPVKNDPNKVLTIELSTVLRVGPSAEWSHMSKLKQESIQSSFGGDQKSVTMNETRESPSNTMKRTANLLSTARAQPQSAPDSTYNSSPSLRMSSIYLKIIGFIIFCLFCLNV